MRWRNSSSHNGNDVAATIDMLSRIFKLRKVVLGPEPQVNPKL